MSHHEDKTSRVHAHRHAEVNHRHKHVATWVAAAGTLAVIMALWAMLLPTQLGGNETFGIKNAANWMSGRTTGEYVDHESAFQEALMRTQAVLQESEEEQQAQDLQARREQALQQEANILRAKIEAASILNQETVEPKKK